MVCHSSQASIYFSLRREGVSAFSPEEVSALSAAAASPEVLAAAEVSAAETSAEESAAAGSLPPVCPAGPAEDIAAESAAASWTVERCLDISASFCTGVLPHPAAEITIRQMHRRMVFNKDLLLSRSLCTGDRIIIDAEEFLRKSHVYIPERVCNNEPPKAYSDSLRGFLTIFHNGLCIRNKRPDPGASPAQTGSFSIR